MSTDATAQSIARFWDRYIEQLNKHHVKPALQRWYVRHVECLISANANLRLAQYTPQTLEAYLQTLGRKPTIKDWQFAQHVGALQILFCDLLRSPWAVRFPWAFWQQSSRELDASHPTISRECHPVTPSQVPLPETLLTSDKSSCHHTTLLDALRSAIRAHHYSIRTEKSYVD